MISTKIFCAIKKVATKKEKKDVGFFSQFTVLTKKHFDKNPLFILLFLYLYKYYCFADSFSYVE